MALGSSPLGEPNSPQVPVALEIMSGPTRKLAKDSVHLEGSFVWKMQCYPSFQQVAYIKFTGPKI